MLNKRIKKKSAGVAHKGGYDAIKGSNELGIYILKQTDCITRIRKEGVSKIITNDGEPYLLRTQDSSQYLLIANQKGNVTRVMKAQRPEAREGKIFFDFEEDPSCAHVLKTLNTWGIKPKKMIIRNVWQRYKSHVADQTPNALGAVRLVDSRTKAIFWIDTEYDAPNKGPYLREPQHSVEDGEMGSQKKVIGSDRGYCERGYILLHAPEQTMKEARLSNAIAANLLPYKSVLKGRFVDACKYIAYDGGLSISENIRAQKKISIGAFRLACDELRQMHQQDIFLRDIKPQNMVMHMQQAKHIDIDFVYIPRVVGDPHQTCCTLSFVSRKLLFNREKGSYSVACDAMKRSDNYAMLRTMMYAALIPRNILNFFLGHGLDGMHIQPMVVSWVEHHVKKHFQNEIKSFLIEPAIANVRDLCEVINWDAADWPTAPAPVHPARTTFPSRMRPASPR